MLTQVASSRHTPYAVALVQITARRRDFYRISIAVAIRSFDPSLFTRLIVPTALSRVSSMGIGFHYTTMLLKGRTTIVVHRDLLLTVQPNLH